MAGNIFNILKEGFDLGGSIGIFIEKKLQNLVAKIDQIDNWNDLNHEEKYLLNNLGDPILKALLIQRKDQRDD